MGVGVGVPGERNWSREMGGGGPDSSQRVGSQGGAAAEWGAKNLENITSNSARLLFVGCAEGS